MEESPLTYKNNPNMYHLIDDNAKVSNFVNPSKHSEIETLSNILPDPLLIRLWQSSFLLLTLWTKIALKFTYESDFLVKTAIWAINTQVHLHLNAKLLNSMVFKFGHRLKT